MLLHRDWLDCLADLLPGHGDLRREPLFGKIAHRIVVGIRQEVGQLVLCTRILLQQHLLGLLGAYRQVKAPLQ